MRLLTPRETPRLGNGFSNYDLNTLCVESPKVLLKNEKRKISHPLSGGLS